MTDQAELTCEECGAILTDRMNFCPICAEPVPRATPKKSAAPVGSRHTSARAATPRAARKPLEATRAEPISAADEPPPPKDRKTARSEAKAEKARVKALRPWWKKKRFIIPLATTLVLVAIAAANTGGTDKPDSGQGDAGGTAATQPAAPAATRLFPGRVDAQKEDQERNIGEAAQLSGYTATVTAAGFRQSLSQFESDGYVEIAVTIENRDSKAQPYNPFDWKLQTPSGQVINHVLITGNDEAMHSGDLVQGGSVSGKIFFEVNSQKGDYYIIYKPDPYDAARGIWKVTI